MIRRSRIETCADVMKAIRDENNSAITTHLMNKANLSWTALKQNLADLLLVGYVQKTWDTRYSLTETGSVWLQSYELLFHDMFSVKKDNPVEA
ncbi:MAG: winged helix-turn-helix domain-containing protein [Nitrososphaerales archaeon]